MALFGTFEREARRRFPALLRQLPALSIIVFLAGIACLLNLPREGQFRNTYISENALLPGQANTYFQESEWHIQRAYRQETRLLINDPGHKSTEARAGKIRALLDDIGYETAFHHWHSPQGENGTTAYGILHAPRGDNTESVVFVAPWLNHNATANEGGISLALSLARYFKRWSLWSKNLIFVFPDDTNFCLRSWVAAYHEDLPKTAGAIQAALTLDYTSEADYFSSIELVQEGLNGELPNLDLLNSIAIIAQGMNIPVLVEGRIQKGETYRDRLITLLSGIFRQTRSGIYRTYGNEAFSGWRIDAITISARFDIPTDMKFDETVYGRVIEATLRSVNNLLEHFHQSFFFYLLLGPKYFVSIGTYLPVAMLVAQSFSLVGLYFLAMCRKCEGFSRRLLRAIAFFSAGLVLDAVLAVGSVSISVTTLTRAYYLTLISSLGIFIVSLSSGATRDPIDIQFLQATLFLLQGAFLTTLSTVNFSLALSLGCVTFPLTWIRIGSPLLVSIPILIATSPFTFLYGLSKLNPYMFPTLADVLGAFTTAWTDLGCWTWLAILIVWLPVWIGAAVVATARLAPAAISESKKNQ